MVSERKTPVRKTPGRKILILGGTADSRKLAALCVAGLGPDIEVISSLAGRTRSVNAEMAGTVRVGGFGGQQGLHDYLLAHDIDLLVDATHPFAATISHHAAGAAHSAGVPRLVIDRPVWKRPAGLTVHEVAHMSGAAEKLAELKPRVALLTTGVKGLETFGSLQAIHFVIRWIEDHEGPPPFPNAGVIVQRPPFDRASERRTMVDHGVDVLVSKESGGSATAAKLTAAQELNIPVVMVRRPPLPAVLSKDHVVSSPEAALEWVRGKLFA